MKRRLEHPLYYVISFLYRRISGGWIAIRKTWLYQAREDQNFAIELNATRARASRARMQLLALLGVIFNFLPD